MKNTCFAPMLVLLWASAANGQGAVPIGGEFQINIYTPGIQTSPAISQLADGGFIVVWHSSGSSGSDNSGYSIQGLRYGIDGAPAGEQFQVNSYTTGRQIAPAVTALSDDGFVVIWESLGSASSSYYNLQGQRYDAGGTALGGQFPVSSYRVDTGTVPSVAALADGSFVVVWNSFDFREPDNPTTRVQGQIFAADGEMLGEQFQINTYTDDGVHSASAAALADGGFVAVWQNYTFNPRGGRIRAQLFAADGTALGGELQVSTDTASSHRKPSAAPLADGGFVVVWESDGSSGSDSSFNSIQSRRFAAGGAPLGPQFQVNSYTHLFQESAAVAAEADSGFVVAWESFGSNGSDVHRESVQGQRYAANGKPLGGQFQINSYTYLGQDNPSIAVLTDGDLVAVWESDGSSGTDPVASIQGQRFTAPRFALVGLGGKCLGVEAANPADGTPVNLYRCDGGENQRWRLDLTDLPQRVVGIEGKCLMPDPAVSGDPRMVIGECGDLNGGDLWQLTTPGSSAPSALIHADTGLCLAVEGSDVADGTPTVLSACHGGADQTWRPAAEVCTRDFFGRCLNQKRFRVELGWRSFDDTTGRGKVVPVGSDDSGLLWFFESDNWEMLIKVLDGCEINDRFWVFAAGTTTVEYTLRVTDTAIGSVVEYFNPLGNAAAAITDTDAFATCAAAPPGSVGRPTPVEAMFRSHPSGVTTATRSGIEASSGAGLPKGTCDSSPTLMCLSDDRFSLEVAWRDYAGNTGSGRVVPAGSSDSGMFYFFNSSNWEMLVKVLDACHLEDARFLMLAAATTDVEYTLRVTDTEAGVSREYFNPLGNAAAALVDNFETCP